MPCSPRPGPILVAIAWLLSGLLAACGTSARQDAEAVRALVAREASATNAKDLKALGEIWSQDRGILLFDVPPPGRFQGWDTIGRLFKDFFDRFSEIHLAFDNVQVVVDGTLAYATYDWTMTGRMGEYAVNDRGEATSIYRKEPGGWRLVHLHYSSVPPALADQPAAPPASETTRKPQANPSRPGASPPKPEAAPAAGSAAPAAGSASPAPVPGGAPPGR